MYCFPKTKPFPFASSDLADVYKIINQLPIDKYMQLPARLGEKYPMLFCPQLDDPDYASEVAPEYTSVVSSTNHLSEQGYYDSIHQQNTPTTTGPNSYQTIVTTTTAIPYYEVHLISAPHKIEAIKEIRRVNSIGLTEAKELVDSCPVTVLVTPNLIEATGLRDALIGTGGNAYAICAPVIH